jgi:hypothetical protein
MDTGRFCRAMSALDQLIVAALLVLPQSYFLWLSSSEFGAPLRARIWIFALPAALIAARGLWSARATALRVDAPVVAAFFGVMAVGLVNALFRTAFPLSVLSTYAQQVFWIGLAILMLKWTTCQPPMYLLDLVRRYYLAVAAIGVVYVGLRLVVGDRLPHTDLTMLAGKGQLSPFAENFYVSLAYDEHGAFHLPVARFTFLYREPKILAIHLLTGILLQVAHVAREWSGPRRGTATIGLIVMVVGLVLANSIFAYMLAAVLVACLAVMPWLRHREWRGLRGLGLAAVGVGLPMFVIALTVIGRDRHLLLALAQVSGRHVVAVRGYVEAIPRAMLSALSFPLGTGTMNLDSPRYVGLFDVTTSGGTTLVQWFAQNAGVPGFAALAFIMWRLLGLAERLTASSTDVEVQIVCLGLAFMLVGSAMIADMLLTGAEGTLLVGWLMHASFRSRASGTPATVAR